MKSYHAALNSHAGTSYFDPASSEHLGMRADIDENEQAHFFPPLIHQEKIAFEMTFALPRSISCKVLIPIGSRESHTSGKRE